MKRNVCRGCTGDNLEIFLDLGNMPLAGGFLADQDAIESESLFPLPIYVCNDCGLVQILDVVDPEILFQDYSFSSSTVAPLLDHFSQYAHWLKNTFDPSVVVEFGCNDGILLKPLEDLGVTTFGVDVSENITEMARKEGLDVITGYFDIAVAKSIREKIGKADVITGSNAFAHNDEPGVILEAARKLLKPNGVLCLEFMYAGDLLDKLQWDTLYHEHLTFYSVSSLAVLLERFGFKILDAIRVPMHGGSLRVVATMNSDRISSEGLQNILIYENERALMNPETWNEFGQKIGRKIDIVSKTLSSLNENNRIWGYGAAGKATLWVNACNLSYLEAMVDSSPLRAGKLMPGTHTPIVFPEKLKDEPPDYIFISAWNYASLIQAKEDWYEGMWITPLPDMKIF